MSIIEQSLQRVKARREPDVSGPVRAGGQNLRAAASPAPLRPLVRDTERFEINVEDLRRQHIYPPADTLALRQNEYRSIRRMVFEAAFNGTAEGARATGPIVVVSSALPGEGKTFTCLNLAFSMASEGTHPVVLIDGDIFRSSLSRALHLDQARGLTDLLADPTLEPWSLVLQSSVPGLYVLPAGGLKEHASDLISAERVGAVLSTLASELTQPVLLIDTPPLLLSSEAAVLADCAGQVLLVVRAGQTLEDAVKHALAKLRESLPVGVILNAWEPTLLTDKTYYGTYYK